MVGIKYSIHKYIPKSKIPASKSGSFRVVKLTISEKEAADSNILTVTTTEDHRTILPGRYTALIETGGPSWMSDVSSELEESLIFWCHARGNVLINGLGLGVIARAVLLKPDVERVIINELSLDVINLIAPHLEKEFGDKVRINNEDAFHYKPNGDRFDAVWHDIWPETSIKNYEEMKKLHRRYGQWLANSDCFNSSWNVDWVKNMYFTQRRW